MAEYSKVCSLVAKFGPPLGVFVSYTSQGDHSWEIWLSDGLRFTFRLDFEITINQTQIFLIFTFCVSFSGRMSNTSFCKILRKSNLIFRYLSERNIYWNFRYFPPLKFPGVRLSNISSCEILPITTQRSSGPLRGAEVKISKGKSRSTGSQGWAWWCHIFK